MNPTYSDEDYDNLDFTLKDCLLGQVRATDDNVYRGYGLAGKALPSKIPAMLKPFVKDQQIITWDNATGMNPLWNKAPGNNVMYKTYGNMLRDAYETSVHNGLHFVPDLIDGGLSASQYDQKIKEDHNNNYSMVSWVLGYWWHVHQILNQPDALDYDYLVVRQMDTWYYPILTKKHIYGIFEHNKRQVLLSPQFDEPATPINDIPVAWASVTTNPIFPMTTWIESYFYMLNRSTIKILRKDFFTKILQEIEIFYQRNGPKTRPIVGKPGTIFHHVAIKNDITVINTDNQIYIWIPDRRSVSVKNYSRNERNVTQVKL